MTHWSIPLVASVRLERMVFDGLQRQEPSGPHGTSGQASKFRHRHHRGRCDRPRRQPRLELALIGGLTHSNAVTGIPVGVNPRTVAVDDDGARAYVANRGSASVSVIDLVARKRIADIATGFRPYGVLVSPDSSRLYVAEQGASQVRVWNAQPATIALLPTRKRPSGLAITGDGRTLYVTHLLSNALTAIALRTQATYLPLLLRTLSSTTSESSPIGLHIRPASNIQLQPPTSSSNFQPPTSNFQPPASPSGPPATWFSPSSSRRMGAGPGCRTPGRTRSTGI